MYFSLGTMHKQLVPLTAKSEICFTRPPPGRHRAPNQRCRYGVYIKARSTPLINKVFGQLNILISEKKHLAHSCKFDF